MRTKRYPAAALAAVFLAASLSQPVSAGTWRTAEDGLYYREAGKDTVGWKRIADDAGVRHWYYFGEDGRLARNMETPDGFLVNEAGMFGGISDHGVSPAFAAAEKAAETARQAGERAYYEELYRKKAEEEARAAAEAQAGPNGSGDGAQETESAGAGGGETEAEIPPYVSKKKKKKYGAMLQGIPEPKLSGIRTGGMPAEFFMLCVAGETSGGADFMNSIIGDSGRAYGFCQYDYRYDLVDFLKYACGLHPQLWSGAEAFLNRENGDIGLVENASLKQMFRRALLTDPETAMSDQLNFMRMLYWDDFARDMDAAGFRLGERNVAVQAALFSVNVNCGPHAEIFIQELRPEISDQEFLDRIYELRNTVFAEMDVQGLRKKGTSERYLSAEPEMAADLMYGKITLDEELDYGGGVEWYGNPF